MRLGGEELVLLSLQLVSGDQIGCRKRLINLFYWYRKCLIKLILNFTYPPRDTTLKMVFSVTYYLELCNARIVYFTSHFYQQRSN